MQHGDHGPPLVIPNLPKSQRFMEFVGEPEKSIAQNWQKPNWMNSTPDYVQNDKLIGGACAAFLMLTASIEFCHSDFGKGHYVSSWAIQRLIEFGETYNQVGATDHSSEHVSRFQSKHFRCFIL